MRDLPIGFGTLDTENRKFNLGLAFFVFTFMAVYAAAFPLLIRNYGPAIRLFAVLFIMPAAVFWGIKGGIATGFLTIALNLTLHIVYGIEFEGGAIGPIAVLVSVVIVGRVSDLRRELKIKIHELRMVRDALQTSETKFRKLFEMESDAVFLAEVENHQILEVNKAAEELFGYNREELLQMTIFELVKEPEQAIANIQKRVENVPINHACKKNGTVFPIEVSARHFELHGRQVLIIAARDITFRKRAAVEKRNLEKKLYQAQRLESIGTLAGGIAHDFNNILAAIIGFAELLDCQNDNLKTNQKNYLKQVLSAADRAKQLVVQILTFSRQSETRKSATRIKPIVEDAIQLLRASIPASVEIRKTAEIENDTIIADPTQIYQIIINLCTNSAQAMAGNSGTIEVALSDVILDEEFTSLHSEIEPGPFLEISVKDNGKGMQQEILERIFEPYFTTKDKSKGTGLGLSVVHGIVMQNHGCITVESRPGKGTTFKVYFPLTLLDTDIVQNQIELLPTGTENVLVVDDEVVLSEMITEMLEMLGYRVERRVNSFEALELFKAKPYDFDLVITDMSMPNMSGTELGMEILRINPDIPIIICTGYSESIDEINAKSRGFQKLLMKPVVLHDLAVSVREALKNSHEKIET